MAPSLTCVLLVKTGLQGWEKMLNRIFQDMEGLTINIDVVPESMLPNLKSEVELALMHLQGEVDPIIFIKKLSKTRVYALLYRMEYGYEVNPEETRKQNNQFMECMFKLNTLEENWDKRIIGALKPIQGLSFTIDAPTEMVYLYGNIEIGVLMKMLVKTGIQLLKMDHGEYKDPNSNPPAKKLEAAPANETETQPAKDTVPTPPEDLSTSTKHNKKPRGFGMFCCC